MPYNFVANTFYTKERCSRLSRSATAILDGKRLFGVFQPPFGGRFRSNVRWSS